MPVDERASAAGGGHPSVAHQHAQQLHARSSGSICSRARAPRQRGSTNAAEAGRQKRKQRCHNTSMAQPAGYRGGRQGQQGRWEQGARSGSRPAGGRTTDPPRRHCSRGRCSRRAARRCLRFESTREQCQSRFMRGAAAGCKRRVHRGPQACVQNVDTGGAQRGSMRARALTRQCPHAGVTGFGTAVPNWERFGLLRSGERELGVHQTAQSAATSPAIDQCGHTHALALNPHPAGWPSPRSKPSAPRRAPSASSR